MSAKDKPVRGRDRQHPGKSTWSPKQVRSAALQGLQVVGELLANSPCMRVERAEPRCFDKEDARLRTLVGKRGAPAILYRDPGRMCDECAALELVYRAQERLR